MAAAVSQAGADLADIEPLKYPQPMLRVIFEGLLPDCDIEELGRTCDVPSRASLALQQYQIWPEVHLLSRVLLLLVGCRTGIVMVTYSLGGTPADPP